MRTSTWLASAGFAALLALGSAGSAGCDMLAASSCSGGDHTTTKSTDIMLGGDTFTLIDSTCSTCGHESVQVTWKVDNPATVTGTVEIESDGSCNGIVVMPYITTLQAKDLGGMSEPPNLKNLCGDSAAETWWVTVRSHASVVIFDVSIRLTCPTYTTPTLLAPTPISIRGW